MADVIVEKIFGAEVFTWGGNNPLSAGEFRSRYLTVLRAANNGSYNGLKELPDHKLSLGLKGFIPAEIRLVVDYIRLSFFSVFIFFLVWRVFLWPGKSVHSVQEN